MTLLQHFAQTCLWARLVDHLVKRAQRTPYFNLKGYMNRWWLVHPVEAREEFVHCGKVSWRRPLARLIQMTRWTVRIHEILRSDNDRSPHDHPWSYITVILRGGYWEERPTWVDGLYIGMESQWHGPGSVLRRKATDIHKLTMPGPTLTLFICKKHSQAWGFFPMLDKQKVYWKEYRSSGEFGADPYADDRRKQQIERNRKYMAMLQNVAMLPPVDLEMARSAMQQAGVPTKEQIQEQLAAAQNAAFLERRQ